MLMLNDILAILSIDRDLTLLRNYYNSLKALCESDFFKEMHAQPEVMALPDPASYLRDSAAKLDTHKIPLDDVKLNELAQRSLEDREYWRGLDKYAFNMSAFETDILQQYNALRRLFKLYDMKQDLLAAALEALNNIEDETAESDNASLGSVVHKAVADPEIKELRATMTDLKANILNSAMTQQVPADAKKSRAKTKTSEDSGDKKKKKKK